MTSPTRMLLAVALLLLLFGCAGRDFVRPDPESLANGRTTYSQVIEKFGPPRQEGTAIKNDKTVKTMSYGYAAMGGKPVQEDVVPARVMGFYFFDDILVGHEFLSTWEADHTNFDEDRIKDIVKGKTTRAELVKLMGRPSGYQIYPLIKSTTGEAMAYVYMQVAGGPFTMRMYRKALVVTIDASGVVTEVEFSAEGKK